MESQTHTLSQLFAQLGLPDDHAEIERFISRHAPLAHHIDLTEAPFWSPAQAALLRTERAKDADWVELIDGLDALMRRN